MHGERANPAKASAGEEGRADYLSGATYRTANPFGKDYSAYARRHGSALGRLGNRTIWRTQSSPDAQNSSQSMHAFSPQGLDQYRKVQDKMTDTGTKMWLNERDPSKAPQIAAGVTVSAALAAGVGIYVHRRKKKRLQQPQPLSPSAA